MAGKHRGQALLEQQEAVGSRQPCSLSPMWSPFSVAHSGGDDGFVSKMTVLPDAGVGVVLMSNCEFAPMSEAEQLLLREAIATAAA